MGVEVKELFLKSGCKFVFVNNDEEASQVVDRVLLEKPDYRYDIHELFATQKKVGPFQVVNKNSIWDVLSKSKDIKNEGTEFLMKQLRDLDLYYYMDRIPRTLTVLQRLRASIGYDVMNGVRTFLLNDCSIATESGERLAVKDKTIFLTLVLWMKNYVKDKKQICDVIWISDLSMERMISLLGDDEFESGYYTFFRYENQNIISCDMKNYTEIIENRNKANELYETGRKFDAFTAMGLHAKRYDYNWLDSNDAIVSANKAFMYYQSAVELDHWEAMSALASYYYIGRGVCNVDLEKALTLYTLSYFHASYDEKKVSDDQKKFHKFAENGIKRLVVELPNGKQIVQNLVGSLADEIIRDAEVDHALEKGFEMHKEEFKKHVFRVMKDFDK